MPRINNDSIVKCGFVGPTTNSSGERKLETLTLLFEKYIDLLGSQDWLAYNTLVPRNHANDSPVKTVWDLSQKRYSRIGIDLSKASDKQFDELPFIKETSYPQRIHAAARRVATLSIQARFSKGPKEQEVPLLFPQDGIEPKTTYRLVIRSDDLNLSAALVKEAKPVTAPPPFSASAMKHLVNPLEFHLFGDIRKGLQRLVIQNIEKFSAQEIAEVFIKQLYAPPFSQALYAMIYTIPLETLRNLTGDYSNQCILAAGKQRLEKLFCDSVGAVVESPEKLDPSLIAEAATHFAHMNLLARQATTQLNPPMEETQQAFARLEGENCDVRELSQILMAQLLFPLRFTIQMFLNTFSTRFPPEKVAELPQLSPSIELISAVIYALPQEKRDALFIEKRKLPDQIERQTTLEKDVKKHQDFLRNFIKAIPPEKLGDLFDAVLIDFIKEMSVDMVVGAVRAKQLFLNAFYKNAEEE